MKNSGHFQSWILGNKLTKKILKKKKSYVFLIHKPTEYFVCVHFSSLIANKIFIQSAKQPVPKFKSKRKGVKVHEMTVKCRGVKAYSITNWRKA